MICLGHILFAVFLVPGSTGVWTDGANIWGGNPWCAEAGFLLNPDSLAIDKGELLPIHCSTAGPNDSGCVEWFGVAPDIGACEYVPIESLSAPSDLQVSIGA